MMGPGPHTPAGLIRSTTVGGVTGAIPVPGGAGDNLNGGWQTFTPGGNR